VNTLLTCAQLKSSNATEVISKVCLKNCSWNFFLTISGVVNRPFFSREHVVIARLLYSLLGRLSECCWRVFVFVVSCRALCSKSARSMLLGRCMTVFEGVWCHKRGITTPSTKTSVGAALRWWCLKPYATKKGHFQKFWYKNELFCRSSLLNCIGGWEMEKWEKVFIEFFISSHFRVIS
jgi:hypothetical protein